MNKYVKLIIDNSATSDSGDESTELIFQNDAEARKWVTDYEAVSKQKLISYIRGLFKMEDKKAKMGTFEDFKKMIKEKSDDEMFECVANALKNAIKKPHPQATDN